MPSGIFCWPPAPGCLVLAVTFAFPGGSANCFAHAPDHTPCLRSWLPAGFFCEAVLRGQLLGVCVPLPFAVLLHAAAPVHALSLCW